VELGCAQPGGKPAKSYAIVLKGPRAERERERVVKERLLSDLAPKSYEEMAEELKREVRMLQKCQGPNIVEAGPRAAPGCPAVLSWNQRPAIVLRKYHFSLRELLSASKWDLSPKLIYSYTAHLIKGVAHCHRMGVNHNDISPDNVLLNKKGKLVLADFEHASGRVCLGKLWYTAPELVLLGDSAEVDTADEALWGANRLPFGRRDVWSVGAVIMEMVAKRPAFPGDSFPDQIRRICRGLGSPTEASWPDHSKFKGWDPTFEQFTTRTRASELLKGQHSGQLATCLDEWLFELCDAAVRYPAERASSAELLERVPKQTLEIVAHIA